MRILQEQVDERFAQVNEQLSSRRNREKDVGLINNGVKKAVLSLWGEQRRQAFSGRREERESSGEICYSL